MVYGVGIDLVAVSRVQRLLDRWGERFIARCFTPSEIAYCRERHDAAAHFAGRFAVKEALLKCLGTGLQSGVALRDIGVTHGERGKPELQLFGKASSLMKERAISSACVSISHTAEYATAIVLLEM